MIVRVDRLTKRFPRQRGWQESLRSPFARPTTLAVDAVSFDVREREIFGLLGQNGAGKTTLFKMLATLVTADDGSATVDGHDVGTAGGEVRQLLAPVLANERSLYWRLSASENLRLYSALQGLHGSFARAEEVRVLAVTGLNDTEGKLVGTFSTGMRQRLLIARALLGRPRILLLDEPTRSLDPISARDFRAFLRSTIVGTEGCTVLLATHDAEEVWELCDRVGVLERGRLLAVDSTSALRHRTGRAAYDVWMRAADGPDAAQQLAAAGHTLKRLGEAEERGWERFRCAIGGGADDAATVLAILTSGGRAVARFERVAPSLADLIERVLTASPGGRDA